METHAAIETIVREEWGRVLATLVGSVRDLGLAEDVLQDAVVAAVERWPRDGVPDNPRGWLLQTARRKAIDRFRRDGRMRTNERHVKQRAELERGLREDETETEPVDQRLSLMFLCCHPALAESSRVALTLKTLGGLTTTEIARAFLVAETTLAQRLVRATRKIRAAGIPYGVPAAELWPERLASVLSVIYLIFNEGYAASSGRAPTRADLCCEAIRLGRILVGLAPNEPEVGGLLALMLLHDSRRDARVDRDGSLVTLELQDRSRWDTERIVEGERLLRRALVRGRPGPFQVQAAISAVHAEAPSFGETDWRQIVGLYERLDTLQPSPVVRLNAAVARSFADGPAAGLAALDTLGGSRGVGPLARYQPFHAARADMLRRSGALQEAAAAYRTALDLTRNEADRRYLRLRLTECDPDSSV